MHVHVKRVLPYLSVETESYSTLSSLRNREIETETLIFAPISLSYIEIDADYSESDE